MQKAVSVPTDGLWTWEVFLLGGGSILTCLACWAFSDKSMSVTTMSQLAFGLAFAVNHPHFLSSYVILYNDLGANIMRRPRYFWAAVVVPVLLAGYLFYALTSGRAQLIGHTVNTMYFLVGWHYVKQVFGCIIVTSARRRLFYKNWERRLMLGNLVALWSISFLQSQTSSPSFTFYGIVYSGLQLDPFFLQIAYAAVVISLMGVVGMHVRKYIYEGVQPTYGGMVAHAALYVWYLPAFSHPGYAYLIPFFHSLQYLVFVWSLKSNQVSDQIKDLAGPEARLGWITHFVGWGVAALVLGAMAFEFVPKSLDSQGLIHSSELGYSPVLVGFLLFINIHHYFIDNVIWRSNNELVKRYLFAAPVTEEPKSKSPRAA